jgi:hypothetical protein
MKSQPQTPSTAATSALSAEEKRRCLSALADGDASALAAACQSWREDASTCQTWHAYT